MLTIYKYRLLHQVVMPYDARILKIGFQDEHIYLWAIVNTTNDPHKYYFDIIQTGVDLDGANLQGYVGTVVSNILVWHVFKK